MRIENKPDAWGALAGLLVLLLAALANACAHAPKLTPQQTRTLSLQSTTAVVVATECGTGSGVLYDGARVLTAHHVVDCDMSEDKVKLATTVTVTLSDGKTYAAAYDALDASRDLARLRLPTPVANVATPSVARAVAGQVVCAITSTPAREVHCGVVGGARMPRSYGDIPIRGAQLWLGNSGSPLYNVAGELVGVVVRMYFCNREDGIAWETRKIKPKRTCGGRATSLEGPVVP